MSDSELIKILEEQIERLSLEIRQSHDRIRWLEEELQRHKRLLIGEGGLSDNFKTPPPRE